VFLAASLTGLVFGIAVLDQGRLIVQDQILASQALTADTTAELIGTHYAMTRSAAMEFADRPELRQALADGDFGRLNAELERFISVHAELDSVALYDVDGSPLVIAVPPNRPRTAPGPVADQEWFTQVVGTGTPYLGLPRVSALTAAATIPYGTPIANGQGDVQAVLLTDLSLRQLSEAVTRASHGAPLQPSLIDRRQDGAIIAHSDLNRLLTQPSGRNPALTLLLDGENGQLATTNSAGASILAAFSQVPRYTDVADDPARPLWGVLVLQPTESATAPFRQSALSAILLCAMAVIGVSALGSVLAFQITRPLMRLREAAAILASGDLTRRVRFTQNDEIGDLGRTFDQMADALAERADALQSEAFRDSLTGLYNRRYLDATLEREILRSLRSRLSLAVIMLDIDFFKKVNDTFGHPMGDALLKEFAQMLRRRTRAEDVAARYGGEEFVLVLPNISLDVALRRAESVREGMADLAIQAQLTSLGPVTVSAGLAVHPDHGASGALLLAAADAALYRAKREGRNRVVVADASPAAPASRS
jgi:diguanylate cyclase (GGDEF)-like protein